jgi:hypothetical protein
MSQPEMDYADGYLAMYAFLDLLWRRKDEAWDELAGMLGSMSLLRDGTPADQAYAQDWDEALERATGRRRGSFTPAEMFQAMLAFLRAYESRGADDEFKRLIVRLTAAVPANSPPTDPQVWQDWIGCVEQARANEVDARLILVKGPYATKPSAVLARPCWNP